MHSLFSQSNGQASTDVLASDSTSPAEGYSGKRKTSSKRLATPYRRGDGYSMRVRYKGYAFFLSGYESPSSVRTAMRMKCAAVDQQRLVPDRTTVAQALQDYAMKRLPFLKSAVQEAARINRYLRFAGLQTLLVTRHEKLASTAIRKQTGIEKKIFFVVTLKPHNLEEEVCGCLWGHGKLQRNFNTATEMHRAMLARTMMRGVQPRDVQQLMDAMRSDGKAASTIALERSTLRVLFNDARKNRGWAMTDGNPAAFVVIPRIQNSRARVMSPEEQQLIWAALDTSRNKLVAPMFALLLETAMLPSEVLRQARWSGVNWERKVLALEDSKNGAREVPLSPLALQALQAFELGAPEAHIVEMSYESLRRSWAIACKQAGIKDLQIRDLRHTAVVRLVLTSGNTLLAQKLTGRKCMDRYEGFSMSDVDSDLLEILTKA
jgi:integrase